MKSGRGRPTRTSATCRWESLKAGDTVLIYWRATSTRKSSCRRLGTPAAPVTIRGVLGPNGERPVIDGNGATTRAQLNYGGAERGVIKIGGLGMPFADGTRSCRSGSSSRTSRPAAAQPFQFTGPTRRH